MIVGSMVPPLHKMFGNGVFMDRRKGSRELRVLVVCQGVHHER
jgi:hypothetical protein